MAKHETVPDVYGPGSYTDKEFIPVPQDAERLLQHIASITPGFDASPEFLEQVQFTGQDLPLLPGPIKAQAFSAVCQAMIGLTAKEILATRNIDSGDVHVDTDLAALYPATVGLVEVDGQDWKAIQKNQVVQKAGIDVDKGVISKTPMRFRSWSIYPTASKDENGHQQWFQVLSSLDPKGFLATFGLDADDESVRTNEKAYERIKAVTMSMSARELESICVEKGYVGQTVLSPKAWRETSYGKALAKHPAINYRQVKGTEETPAVPLPQNIQDKRPLAGVKVLEFSRVIAGPAVGTYLAALGADVIRVQSSNLPDLGFLSVTLQAGKRVADIDLNKSEDRAELQKLVEDADVVVQGFRLKSLERKGFGLDDIVQIARQRKRGAVYVDLNCYGPDGYYAERPGYQQIADCGSGCSYINGLAYGLPEGTGVLPSLPIADMLSGAVGALVTLLGIRDRTTKGGSYHAHVSLMAMDTAQLEPEFGLYNKETVAKVQETYQFGEMRPHHMVTDLLDIMVQAWENHSDVLKKKERFVEFETKYGKKHKLLAPGIKFESAESSPRWEWGPVPNGGQKGLQWRTAA
ncbi:Putative CoA-transferase family III [Septoria linicola]|uniref:CoA-transferase family III n=1 Tax=Septoria linicola TaxID=215465 RepID=A0A9Q9B7X9_9PEZI|nr:Putative CoA-transferase family III [Septoria linicola]